MIYLLLFASLHHLHLLLHSYYSVDLNQKRAIKGMSAHVSCFMFENALIPVSY